MASISFYTSDSINMLLSSGLNRKSSGIFSSQTTNMFSGIDFSTLSSIRNGSYHKLLKSYYANVGSDSTSDTGSVKTDNVQDTAAEKLNGAAVRDEAADLVDLAAALRNTSLWEKKSVTDKEGTVAKEYDKEAIYKAVYEFVSGYNMLLDKTAKSNDNSILRTASSMTYYTKANQSLLKDMGITIGSDNRLSIDEDKFKQADMAIAKSAFSGSNSYGQTISKNASSVYSSAVAQIAKLDSATTYSSSGKYSYVTGATYNRYL